MKLEDYFTGLRKKFGGAAENSRGITKDRIAEVLKKLDRYTVDTCDSVYALLDDTLPSCIPALRRTNKFCSGATTAAIACHVGILQRGKTKLDREGRDYWIKPMRELGAIEPVQLAGKELISGHPIAKSPYSAYRLAPDFVDVLAAKPRDLARSLAVWSSEAAVRTRLTVQASAAADAKAAHTNEHEALIEAVKEYYVPSFLPGYECVYTDSDDGDRVNARERERLNRVGIELKISDAYPDLMLVKGRGLWCAEAVTSDGEVDEHKVENMKRLCERSGLSLDGLTTAYRTWRDLARRQGKHKNLAPETYVWIQENAGTQLKVEAAKTSVLKKK